MFKFNGILLSALLLSGSTNQYGPFHHVQSFMVYYGWSTPEIMKKLKEQDLVVIAPHAFKQEELRTLQESGTLVLGYVSLIQLENWNDQLKEDIKESDYYKRNGQRVQVESYNTYIMDLRESHYRNVLLNKIKTEIVDKQFNGIFFDTIDDIDYYFHGQKDVQDAYRVAYIDLLRTINKKYPKLSIMQNRGFDTFLASTRNKVDAFLWESFDKEEIKKSKWGLKWLSYLKEQHDLETVRIFTITSNQESADFSKKYGFPSYIRNNDTYQ
ncbi:MAG: endo alpha-1,4 polygalactosaminidase [Bacillus sp. (in: Bacteria)]|nr:endo alpha-1,4 polygalactosaminidase [Bacillus sp. (in: firmicutes)]